MKIVQEKDHNELIQKTANYIFSLVEETVNSHKNVLLLLSGGSALDVVNAFPEKMFSESITVGMLDERFETDISANNFLQLKATKGYSFAVAKGSHIIDSLPRENELLGEFAERIENAWKLWRVNNPSGKVFVLQGIGPDGHTAGIMPYSQDDILFEHLFINTRNWIIGYNAENRNKYPLRATATFSFLKQEVDESAVYIVGEEKVTALRSIFQEQGTLSKTPARILREMKAVTIFTTNLV